MGSEPAELAEFRNHVRLIGVPQVEGGTSPIDPGVRPGAHQSRLKARVDGLPAMTALLAPVRGKIRIDRYELLNRKVQRSGDVAVLTYQIVNYQRQQDGTGRPTTRWNSTAVFRRLDGKWRTIHSHFSYTKPELK